MNRKIKVFHLVFFPVLFGILVAFMDSFIIKSMLHSIGKTTDSEFVLKLLLLENQLSKNPDLDRKNFFLYIPTMLFLFGAQIVMNLKVLYADKSLWKAALVRCKSSRKWCFRLTRSGYIKLLLYTGSFTIAVCAFGLSVKPLKYFFLCTCLRMLFLLWLMYFMYYFIRKHNKSIGFLYASILMLVIVMADVAIENICVLSYSTEFAPVCWGFLINIGCLLYWGGKAGRHIARDEIL